MKVRSGPVQRGKSWTKLFSECSKVVGRSSQEVKSFRAQGNFWGFHSKPPAEISIHFQQKHVSRGTPFLKEWISLVKFTKFPQVVREKQKSETIKELIDSLDDFDGQKGSQRTQSPVYFFIIL